MKINQLLSKESKWCQGALARDKKGKPINCLDIKYFDNGHNIDYGKDAVAYSLYGAISHVYQYDDHENVLDKLHVGMRKILGKDMVLAVFNDSEKTTFKMIKDVVNEAGV